MEGDGEPPPPLGGSVAPQLAVAHEPEAMKWVGWADCPSSTDRRFGPSGPAPGCCRGGRIGYRARRPRSTVARGDPSTSRGETEEESHTAGEPPATSRAVARFSVPH